MTGKIKSIAAQYAMITLACALYAVGFNWCFDPNHLSVGGFTGVAQIINFFIPQIPIGVAIIVLNLPLFLLSWTKVGRHWLYATLYATLVSSGMIDLLAGVYTFRPMEPMLAAVYGGVIVGLGCGLMLRYSATTGGTELAARLLKLKLPGLSIGTLCLAIDTIVVVSYAAVFRDLTQALYAMVALFIISKVMDRVVYGGNGAKMAYIVSERYEEITAKLLELQQRKTLTADEYVRLYRRCVANSPALQFVFTAYARDGKEEDLVEMLKLADSMFLRLRPTCSSFSNPSHASILAHMEKERLLNAEELEWVKQAYCQGSEVVQSAFSLCAETGDVAGLVSMLRSVIEMVRNYETAIETQEFIGELVKELLNEESLSPSQAAVLSALLEKRCVDALVDGNNKELMRGFLLCFPQTTHRRRIARAMNRCRVCWKVS